MSASPSLNYQIFAKGDFFGIHFEGCVAKVGQHYEFAALAENIVLSDLVKQATKGTELPAIIPDIIIKKLWLRKNDKLATLKLTATVNEKLPVQGNDSFDFRITKLKLFCEYDLEKKQLKSLKISSHGSLNIPDVLAIPNYQFNLSYVKDSGWLMKADLPKARIFDFELSLNAIYEQKKEFSSFRLGIKKETSLIEVTGLLKLKAKSLVFEITKEKNKPAKLGIASDIKLKLTGIDEQSGRLIFTKSAVCFKSDTPITLHLLDQGHMDVKVRMRLDALRLAWSGTKEFSSELDLEILKQGLPEWLSAIAPDHFKVIFKVDADGCEIAGISTGKPIKFTLPDFELKESGHKVRIPLSELGQGTFELVSIGIKIGSTISFKTEIEFGLPAKINNVFGTEGGRPKHEIFLTERPCKLAFEINQNGVSLQMPVPPIKPEWIEIVEEENGFKWHLKLGENGELGELSMPAPVFEAGLKGFSAKGEFRVIKPLKIPLKPVKQLLKNTFKVKNVDKQIPDNWPIKSPGLIDKDHKFHIEKLISFFKEAQHPLPEELKSFLNEINKVLNEGVRKLPEMLLPYLEAQFDDGFEGFALAFDIDITPDAGFAISVESRVKDKVKGGYKPIRMLWPSPIGLSGCYFKKFSVGTMMGGSLIKVDIDCTFDTFDLKELLVGLLVPEKAPLPLSRNFHNRLVLEELFMVVIYETVIPIPIPIFYNQIKWDYLNIGGFDLGAEFKFPNSFKDVNIIALLQLFNEIRRFLKEKDKRFEPTEAQARLLPTFTIGPVYAQLPKYLAKNSYLGTKKNPSYELHTMDVLAKVLNTIKFFSSESLVKAIPPEYRKGNKVIGKGAMEFAGLSLKGSGIQWLLTTPHDFIVKKEYQYISLKSAKEANTLLQVLPYRPKSTDKGMIAFLRTKVNVEYLAQCTFTFGFVSIDKKSLATGFTFVGDFLSIYKIDLKALISIDKHHFAAKGQAIIKAYGLEILRSKAEILISNGLEFKAELELLKIGSAKVFSGEVDTHIASHHFQYQGHVTFDPVLLPSSSGYLTITNNSGSITTKIWGLTFKWTIVFSHKEVSLESKNAIITLKLALLPRQFEIKGKMKVDFKAFWMEAQLGVPMPDNNYALYFYGFDDPLLTGSMKLSSNGFSISAKLDFKLFTTTLSGHYFPKNNDLFLKGKAQLGNTFCGLRLSIAISTSGVGLSGTLYMFGFEYGTSGAIAYSRELKAPALYLKYTIGKWRFKKTFYFRISLTSFFDWKSISSIIQAHKHKDWPPIAG